VADSTVVSLYEFVPQIRPDCLLLVTETRLSNHASPDDCGESGNATRRVVSDLTYRLESENTQRELKQQLQRGEARQSLMRPYKTTERAASHQLSIRVLRTNGQTFAQPIKQRSNQSRFEVATTTLCEVLCCLVH
jgi:hypothetical protein